MNLNRALIKTQAKELLRGKILTLFLVTFVVLLLTGGSSSINILMNRYDAYDLSQGSNYTDPGDFGDFEYPDDEFGNWSGSNGDSSDNPIDNFDGQIAPISADRAQNTQINGLYGPQHVIRSFFGAFSSLFVIVMIVFSAMLVALDGYYVAFIRTGREIPIGSDLASLFKTTFDTNYGKRLGLSLLRGIFTFLWSLLLVIPGIVYSYSVYFAYEIMADHPGMKPMQALRLSRKMVLGHRSELFTMDLSFILWWLFVICTFGIGGIYVVPYYRTTKALYYENFRLRALACGQITEDDFLSDQELYAKYGAARGYYNAPGNAQNPQQQAYGQAHVNNPYRQTASNARAYGAQDSYYTPPQKQPAAPFTGVYTPPDVSAQPAPAQDPISMGTPQPEQAADASTEGTTPVAQQEEEPATDAQTAARTDTDTSADADTNE